MPKTVIKPLIILILLANTVNAESSTNGGYYLETPSLISAFRNDYSPSLFSSDKISIKRGEKYDESKDPALRRGTENWEQPQSSFFAVPAIVFGFTLLFLFFNRDKGE
jgi:hypothetical protein